ADAGRATLCRGASSDGARARRASALFELVAMHHDSLARVLTRTPSSVRSAPGSTSGRGVLLRNSVSLCNGASWVPTEHLPTPARRGCRMLPPRSARLSATKEEEGQATE